MAVQVSCIGQSVFCSILHKVVFVGRSVTILAILYNSRNLVKCHNLKRPGFSRS